jgi:3-oxoacyl-[acyl-carrier-protein] synthase II
MTVPAVWITGCGVVSPLGADWAAFDSHLFEGRSAVVARSISAHAMGQLTVPLAACDFSEGDVIAPSRLQVDRGAAMALVAGKRAWQEAGLLAAPPQDAQRIGVYWGSGLAGAASFDAACQSLYSLGKRLRPTTVVSVMPNAPVAELALQVSARGAALAYACACASSAVAIGEALRALRAGYIDVALVGGSEAMLTPAVIAAWYALRVLAPVNAASTQEAVQNACRPFAADRNGFALGEGAAALVLERADYAKARGAAAQAVLSGYATNCDARHITNPDPDGQARAMRAALHDAGLEAKDIGYINAHGTATIAGDAAEAVSIAEVFGANGVPVSSTKAIHGHLLGAAGAMELVASLRALQHGALPPTAGLAGPNPDMALDLVCGDARPAPGLQHVMSNSFAFGGTNAVLIASRI